MRPRVGIELDDSSHAREDRQARDAFVEQVFEAAGVALLRFPALRAYNISKVTSRLSPFFAGGAVPPPLPVSVDTISAPLCRSVVFRWLFAVAAAASFTVARIIRGADRLFTCS
jgi:hypothetical protein